MLVSGVTVPQAVARGQADLGFTQISEILDEPEAQFLGPLPASLQTYSVFVAAASPGAKSASAAQSFVKALATPAAKAVMTAKGLQPD